MVDTNKLDKAILNHLYAAKGVQDASVIWWQTHLQLLLGVLPDWAEIESALKRLRAEGIVRLVKYDRELGGWCEYRGDEHPAVDSRFFGFASFETRITDKGRRFWDAPRTPIGFQMPA
jgi:hypothetical protein